MAIFLAAVAMLALSGIVGLLTGKGGSRGEALSLWLLLAGNLAGTAATVAALGGPEPAALSLPWPLPGGCFALAIDGLAAVFLLPAFLVSGLGAIYGLGYWPQRQQPHTGPRLRCFYGLLTATIALLLIARNGILFLLAWELMALSGYFLIIVEDDKAEVRSAGFLYLVATHTGTLALFALFALLAEAGGSFALPLPATISAVTPLATAVFLLALVGFGVKAGLMPLHIWLPGAHAAAPSHVSAFLSGVMIKMGIYGILRVVSWFYAIPAWWGWLVLILGLISGTMGVVLAIAQHDIKRLLAYHSVENIGIIAIGIGVALLGRTYDLRALVTLGLAGALLHVINHGLFKSLLFFSAGSIIRASGTREIDRYGGLLRPLPLTGLFFLGGAVAISGLPPLNGFVSEWFIYLGLLESQQGLALGLDLAVLAAPILALVGGLAVACFVKVFGIAFLGEPRVARPTPAEAPRSMLLPMAALMLLCLAIGLLPSATLPLLEGAVASWSGNGSPAPLASLAPAAMLSRMALLLLLLALALGLFLKRQSRCREAKPGTWDCGFGRTTPRMQYTASSFADTITGIFHWALRTSRHGVAPEGLFPAATSHATRTPDLVLDCTLIPLSRRLTGYATRLRAGLQNGMLNLYLLYAALTLAALLAVLMP